MELLSGVLNAKTDLSLIVFASAVTKGKAATHGS